MSMKKVAAILFLLLFLITNSGLAMAIHWCGGKLVAIDFFSAQKNHCPCGTKPMKKGCCQDRITTIKANDELAKSNNLNFKVTQVSLIPKEFFVSVISAHFHFVISDFYYPPPEHFKVPIYLTDQAFLI